MSVDKEAYFGALTSSGMPEIPQEFSVTPLAQFIPRPTLAEIDKFIRLFDQITTRPSWQNIVTASAPQIAQFPRSEVAFRNQLATFIEREIKQFFGSLPEGLFYILESSDALRSGKFYRELILLRDLLRNQGWQSAIGTPENLRWDGKYLLLDRQPVAFVITRVYQVCSLFNFTLSLNRQTLFSK